MNLSELFVKRYTLLLDFRKTVWDDLTDTAFNQEDFISRPSDHQWSIDELLRHMLASEIRYIQQSIDQSIEQHPIGVPAQWVGKIFFRLEEREHLPLKEVKEIFPQWVSEGASGIQSLAPNGFDALKVEALKELNAENAALKAEMNALESRIKDLEARLKEVDG